MAVLRKQLVDPVIDLYNERFDAKLRISMEDLKKEILSDLIKAESSIIEKAGLMEEVSGSIEAL